jgi:hypothetical protein
MLWQTSLRCTFQNQCLRVYVMSLSLLLTWCKNHENILSKHVTQCGGNPVHFFLFSDVSTASVRVSNHLLWTAPMNTSFRYSVSHAYCWTWCWGSDSHQFFWHMILGSPQIVHNNSNSIWEPSISLTHGLGNWFVWKSAVGYCKSANFLSEHVDTLSYCERSQWLGLFVEILNSMLCVLVSQELAELNRQYEAKFGFVFLVCASGKSSAEILSILKACFHWILSKCCLLLFLSFLKLVSTCMRERWYLVLGKLVAVALDSCS